MLCVLLPLQLNLDFWHGHCYLLTGEGGAFFKKCDQIAQYHFQSMGTKGRRSCVHSSHQHIACSLRAWLSPACCGVPVQTRVRTGALAGPAVPPAAAATAARFTRLQQGWQPPVFSHGNRERERKWQLSAIHMADEPERDFMRHIKEHFSCLGVYLLAPDLEVL